MLSHPLALPDARIEGAHRLGRLLVAGRSSRKDGAGYPRAMTVKRWTAGRWVWIGVAVVALILAARLLSPSGFQQVDTSVALGLIKDQKVEYAHVVDGEQTLELTLKPGSEYQGHSKVSTGWIGARGTEIVRTCSTRTRRARATTRRSRPRRCSAT